MLNSCILTGNLGADPEVFYSSEGDPVATFNLAFRSSKKKTGWIKITCFQRLAETAERYLHKGARVGVIGYLDQQKWETDEGVSRSSFQLIANTLEFIKTDGRGFEEGQDGTPFNHHPMTGIINQKNIKDKGEFTMTARELQKRGAKAELLRVLQTEDGSFYAESAEGKILYRVIADDQETSCTCADFTRNSKKDSNFQCKHILSVLNCVPTGDVESVQYLERKKPKLDERWIIEIEGNQFVKYAGLLDLGHQKGISQIEVEPLQLPTKENGNSAICKATVISKSGESFTDIGDANPGNCSSKVSKHLLRLASTRAIARALRTFTNIGLTALEELADLSDVIGTGPKASSKPKAKKQISKKPKTTKAAESKTKPTQSESHSKAATKNHQIKTDGADDGDGNKPTGGNGNGRSKPKATGKQPGMSEAQKRAIYNLSRRRGVSVENLEEMSLEAYGVAVENLTSKDASAFIRNLQQAA